MYNSNDVADNIRILAKKRNVIIKDMLEQIGLGRNTLANFKTSMPKADNLAKIADYLDCSTDYLLGRTDIPEINRSRTFNTAITAARDSPAPVKSDPDIRKFSQIDEPVDRPMVGIAAAGKPLAMTVGCYDMIRINAVSDAHKKISLKDFVVEIHGDSMADADIYNGDYAVIRPCPMAENGEIALVAVGDDCTLKKFYRTDSGIELHPCNPNYKVQKYKISDGVRIMGIFVCTCKGDIIEQY